jgi:Tol biopolymer transport system component
MDQPLPSTSGGRLFVLGSNEQNEYVRLDLLTHEYRSLLSWTSPAWPVFSNDGQYVVHVSDNILWQSKPDGTSKREIVSSWYRPAHPQWSPDGTRVVFEGSPGDSNVSRIYSVPVEGGAPIELAGGEYPSGLPEWTPDGTAVVFAVPLEAGSSAGLYVCDFKTHATRRLAGSEGYSEPSWSPDGRMLAAVTEDSSRLVVFDQQSEGWTVLAQGRVLARAVWSHDSKYLYFQDVVEEYEPVRRIEIASRRVDRVMDFRALLEGGVQRCHLSGMTRDGALVLRLTRGDHDVYSLTLGIR